MVNLGGDKFKKVMVIDDNEIDRYIANRNITRKSLFNVIVFFISLSLSMFNSYLFF